MLENKDQGGGPAFPFGISHIPDQGLTKRDWFAGMALGGFASDEQRWWNMIDENANGRDHDDTAEEWISRAAYRYADAMLAARQTKP